MSTTVTSAQIYTVQSGDFLAAIAQKFYGHSSDAFWRKIYEANKAVIGPEPARLRPGMVLVIPAHSASEPKVHQLISLTANKT